MEKVYVGKIVNTFGIKGELKIASSFEMPERVFKKGQQILIGETTHVITGLREHKNHYLTQIDDLDNINLVLIYKGQSVFVERSLLNLTETEYLMDDLINLELYENNELIGIVTEVINDKVNPLIKINKQFYIPLKANYIIKVLLNEKKIVAQNIKGLML